MPFQFEAILPSNLVKSTFSKLFQRDIHVEHIYYEGRIFLLQNGMTFFPNPKFNYEYWCSFIQFCIYLIWRDTKGLTNCHFNSICQFDSSSIVFSLQTAFYKSSPSMKTCSRHPSKYAEKQIKLTPVSYALGWSLAVFN